MATEDVIDDPIISTLFRNEIATSSAQKPVVDLISYCRVGFGRNEAEFQGQGRQRVPFLSIKVL